MTSSHLVLTLVNTEDVLKARLKTIGVSEHKFTIETGQHLITCLSPIVLTWFPFSPPFHIEQVRRRIGLSMT